MNPVALNVFFTCGPWYSPLALGIRWLSRRRWYNWLAEVNHMGVEFVCEDGTKWVGESLDEGWEHKVSKLDKRIKDGKKVIRIPIPDMTQEEIQAAWDLSQEWVGTKGYDYPLIAKLGARGTLIGRMLTSVFKRKLAIQNSTRRLDCSEGGSLMLWTATNGWLDLRDDTSQPFGAVTPQSALDKLRAMYPKTGAP